jgi:hypothetical protein
MSRTQSDSSSAHVKHLHLDNDQGEHYYEHEEHAYCHNSFLVYSLNSPFSFQNQKNKIKTGILAKATWEDFI